MLWFATLLLAALPQAAELPFSMDLPDGYSAFAIPAGQQSVWSAALSDGSARFEIRHYQIAVPGALAESVAEDFRQRQWQPFLQQQNGTLQNWAATWSGEPSAGSIIRLTSAEQAVTIFQRVLLKGDRLTLALWEGATQDESLATLALDSFHAPSEWLPAPLAQTDTHRGLGPLSKLTPFPGLLEVSLDLRPNERGEYLCEIHIRDTPEGLPPFHWQLPLRAKLVSKSARYIRYALTEDSLLDTGMLRLGFALAAINPNWMALPEFDASIGALAPPAWKLNLQVAAHLGAVSVNPPIAIEQDEADASFMIHFHSPIPGRSWPVFVSGPLLKEEINGMPIFLRKGSRSKSYAPFLEAQSRFAAATARWLPDAPATWNTTTFAGSGTHSFPGLLLLDENDNWLTSPPDAQWQGLSRRTSIARMAAAQVFGTRLKGLGSASAFLTTSLAEYATAQLLLDCGFTADAAALRAQWVEHEKNAGDMVLPLSLTPTDDISGPQRLLHRGPLVWSAIERLAGQKTLDGILMAFLARNRPFTTEDLRDALEKATVTDWAAFFEAYLYDITPPPLPKS